MPRNYTELGPRVKIADIPSVAEFEKLMESATLDPDTHARNREGIQRKLRERSALQKLKDAVRRFWHKR